MISFIIFIFGFLFGIILSILIGGYLLMTYGSSDLKKPIKQQDNNNNNNNNNENENQIKLKEKDPSDEELQILNDALKVLKGEIDDTPVPELHPSEEHAPTDIKQMENAFLIASQNSKQRQKHLKGLTSFLQEFSALHAQFSKDLKRLSTITQENMISNTVIDKWWNSLSVALEHLAKDENLLRKSIQEDILHPMTRIELEHSHLEKQLNAEGTKLLTKLKETQQNYDLKLKEHEKYKEKTIASSCVGLVSDASVNQTKLTTTTTTSSSTSLSSSSTTIITTTNTTKLHHTETSLIEASGKLASAQQDFNEKMPRILKDYILITSNCVSASMERLIYFSDVFSLPLEKISQITHRLKMDLASSATESIDRSNYNPVVLKLLDNIVNNKPDILLDMSLESSAGLAACSLHLLPELPSLFANSIQNETCVWFNALSGRMYRDAARSEGFHHWFCTKASQLLNKGKKTPLFDKYIVSNPTFGSSPPLLLNVKWVPCTKQTNLNPNLPHQDSEYDVECTADVAFRSSISFTVSTKLWINWPREKCAHIPISIVLELTELSGKIRFGVRKHSSFLSFVEEPYTRFNVTSEVGDQYKLKNIPKVSSLIINKLKKHIRTKLIYPGSFKLRLIWPRKWWPPGGEHLFKSESKETQSSSGSNTNNNTSTEDSNNNNNHNNTTIDTTTINNNNSNSNNINSTIINDNINLNEIKSTPQKYEKKVTVDDVIGTTTSTIDNSEHESLLHRWFWSNSNNNNNNNSNNSNNNLSKQSERKLKLSIKTSLKSAEDIIGQPGSLRVIPRRRMKNDSLGSSPRVSHSGSIVHPDHVRLYVSELLENDVIVNPYYYNNMSADDILVGDKFSLGTESVAIMRSRSHSISDFRRPVLVSMWSEFLGSIGHDFNLLTQNKSLTNSPRAIKKDVIGEFGLFSLKLSSFRKNLRSQRNIKQPNPKIDSSSSSSSSNKNNSSSLDTIANFGLNFLGVSSGQKKTQSKSSNSQNSPLSSKRNLLHELDQLDSNHSSQTNQSDSSTNQYYANKLGRVVDVLSTIKPTSTTTSSTSSTTTISSTSSINIIPSNMNINNNSNSINNKNSSISMSSSSKKYSKQKNENNDIEQEVVNLAWQAQAEAITQAASRGEHLNMQNFLRTPKLSSPKSWVVMKEGNLTIYPNLSSETEGVVEKNQPTAIFSLKGCICRPIEHQSGFEVGFMILKQGKSSIEWVQFWTETDIQCRAWIMALQHSANLISHSK